MSLINDGGELDLANTPPEELVALFKAANERKITVVADGPRLTVRRTVREATRQRRSQRQLMIEEAIVVAIRELGETRVGPLVKRLATTLPDVDDSTIRNEILVACRSLREQGRLVSQNKTNSNFHMTWRLEESSQVSGEVTSTNESPSSELSSDSGYEFVGSLGPAESEDDSASGPTSNVETTDTLAFNLLGEG